MPDGEKVSQTSQVAATGYKAVTGCLADDMAGYAGPKLWSWSVTLGSKSLHPRPLVSPLEILPNECGLSRST